jgi:hypothetical protein
MDQIRLLGSEIEAMNHLIQVDRTRPSDIDIIQHEIASLSARMPTVTAIVPGRSLLKKMPKVERSAFDPFVDRYRRMAAIQVRYHSTGLSLLEKVDLEAEFSQLDMELGDMVPVFGKFVELDEVLREKRSAFREWVDRAELAAAECLEAIGKREAAATDLLVGTLESNLKLANQQVNDEAVSGLEIAVRERIRVAGRLKAVDSWIDGTFQFLGTPPGQLPIMRKLELLRAALKKPGLV